MTMGLETTVRSLKTLDVQVGEVDLILLAIAVNALACLEERDKRYGGAIRLALSIAQGKPRSFEVDDR